MLVVIKEICDICSVDDGNDYCDEIELRFSPTAMLVVPDVPLTEP